MSTTSASTSSSAGMFDSGTSHGEAGSAGLGFQVGRERLAHSTLIAGATESPFPLAPRASQTATACS